MNFRSMKIARRSILCFGLIASFVGALGLFGLSQMSNIRTEGQLIENDSIPGIVSSDNLALQLTRIRAEALRLVAIPDNVTTTQQNIKKISEGADAEFARYEKLVDTKQEQQIYEQLHSTYTTYLDQCEEVVSLIHKNDVNSARNLITVKMASLGAQMNALSKSLQDRNLASAAHHSEVGASLYTSSKYITIGVIFLTLTLTILLSWRMTRSLTMPIEAAVKAAQTIASIGIVKLRVIRQERRMTRSLTMPIEAAVKAAQTIASGSSLPESTN